MRHFLFLCLLKRLAVLAGLPLVLFAYSAISAPTTPNYVQGNYAVPQTPQTTVTVPYTAPQASGNLNVVIVGWNDSTAHVSSLRDSNENVYQLATGPTVVTGTLSQAIYYATVGASGGNAVTVTFDALATYPDIRILEYSGIDPVSPVDAVAGSIGNSATSSSGAVKTTNATDLLLGANMVFTGTTGPGSGFTKRLLTLPDGDIAEDQIVTAAGSYSATAPLGYWGNWVMQMVAFRSASSAPTPTPVPTPSPTPTPTPKTTPSPTPTPTPKTTPSPTPTPTPTPSPTPGSSVTLAWNANLPTSDPATNTTGYRLHLGLASGVYTQSTNVGNTTSVTVSNLISGLKYYFVVTAYNSSGLESPPSIEVSYTAPWINLLP
jgi:Fibronectin type III domain